MKNLKEELFRTAGGELILRGIKEVGINHAVDFGDMHHYPPDNGIPEGTPQEIKTDVFWGAMRRKKES